MKLRTFESLKQLTSRVTPKSKDVSCTDLEVTGTTVTAAHRGSSCWYVPPEGRAETWTVRHPAIEVRMRSTNIVTAIAGIALCAAAGKAANAQSPSSVGGAAMVALRNGSANAAMDDMRARLRQLVTAQEAYWMDHGTYTTDLAALGFYERGKTRMDSAFVQVVFAGGRGWTGMASHRALKGRSCAIYVGNADELPSMPATAADKRRPAEEGAPTCDVVQP